MNDGKRSILVLLIHFAVWVAFLALGDWLFLLFPENEAPGGMVLGFTGVILGIIVPIHLRRTGVVSYSFLPGKNKFGKTAIFTVLFTAALLCINPGSAIRVITQVPAFAPALFTFLFLLLSATAYALIFWGGILHVFKREYGPIAAVLVTGFLFSVYHLSEFAFTPLTAGFLIKMFVGGVLCAGFTVFTGSVFPTLVAQQIGQFMYFVSLDDNPFKGPDGVIIIGILFVVCYAVYSFVYKRSIRTR